MQRAIKFLLQCSLRQGKCEFGLMQPVACAGYASISVLSKHGGLAPLRIGLWKDRTPGKANLGYR